MLCKPSAADKCKGQRHIPWAVSFIRAGSSVDSPVGGIIHSLHSSIGSPLGWVPLVFIIIFLKSLSLANQPQAFPFQPL